MALRLADFGWRALGQAAVALTLCMSLFFAPSALAQETMDAPVAITPQAESHVDETELDLLFPQLANAKSSGDAQAIANQIWQVWLNPTTPELADRMDRVSVARTVGSYQHAIEMLNAVIADFPGYAEAWNQRATLYFFLGNYDASLADIEETLVREPRHFGALSGQAVIYLRLGEDFLARQAILTALKYHPFLPERALFPQLFAPPTQI